MQVARLAGARVIAAASTAAKRDWAGGLGAGATVDGAAAAPAVRTLTGGRGVDCVLDIVGTEASFAAALDSVAGGGRIVVVGYTPDSFALPGKRLAQNEIEVIGSRAGSRGDLAEILALTASGSIRSIVTDRAPLAAVNTALAKLRDGGVVGRLVLDIAPD